MSNAKLSQVINKYQTLIEIVTDSDVNVTLATSTWIESTWLLTASIRYWSTLLVKESKLYSNSLVRVRLCQTTTLTEELGQDLPAWVTEVTKHILTDLEIEVKI